MPDHPDISVDLVLLLDAIGLKDPSLGRQLLSQMAAVADGHEESLNAMIAFVKGRRRSRRKWQPFTVPP